MTFAHVAASQFHQCRWGYRDAFEVAEVIANYTKAEIPLETMWSDIGRLIVIYQAQTTQVQKN